MAEAGTPAERVKVTAADIKHAIAKKYAPPSWRTFFEVANQTGFDVKRRIDALVCGIWPSNEGITGIEIKVSRSDWLQELKDPMKAQELMQYCDKWYLACPAGMVKPDELPLTWGMIVLTKTGEMRTIVPAKRLTPPPIPKSFLMAILRQADGTNAELVERLVAEKDAVREAQVEERIAREVERRSRDMSSKQKQVLEIAAFVEKATGKPYTDWDYDGDAMAGYQLLRAAGVCSEKAFAGIPGAIMAAERLLASLSAINDMPALQHIRETIQAAKQGRNG